MFAAGGQEVAALAGVSLAVVEGEFLAVTGVSGSGKSTLLHVLGGLDSATSGTVHFRGREVTCLSTRELAGYRGQSIGFVFQAFHLAARMTAEANVALALTFQGTYGSERQRRSHGALERVGLSHRRRHRASELSGGEQQRVALARAIVTRPPLLLLDEPTGNLDGRTASEIMTLLQEIRREDGTTVVMVTHDDGLVARYADRSLRLRDGRVISEVPS